MENKLEIGNDKNNNPNNMNMNNQKIIQHVQFKTLTNKKIENKNNDFYIKDNSPKKYCKSSPKQSENTSFDNKSYKKRKNNDKILYKYNKTKILDGILKNKEVEKYFTSETREKMNQMNSKKSSDIDKGMSPKFLIEKQINISDLKNDLKKDSQNNNGDCNILKKNTFDENCSNLNIDPNKTNSLQRIKIKQKKKPEIDYSKIYEQHKMFAGKHNIFLILFIAGIVLNFLSFFMSVYLQLYGNKDAYLCFCLLEILIVVFYSLGIVAVKQYKQLVYSIIKNKDDPEKIFQSRQRKNIFLFLYAILISLNYQLVILTENTVFINNIKMNIRGKGYDIRSWMSFFQNKNYSEILGSFQKFNIAYLIFSWLSSILTLFIIIYILYFLKNYRTYKSIIQILCTISIQASFFQIYFGKYCESSIKITSLDDISFSWVIVGEIINGVLGFCIGMYGLYIFFTENKRLIFIFNFVCLGLFLLSGVFSGALRGLGSKFTGYKSASCNTLFKFISEDSLVFKNSDCANKYLFTTDSLEGIQCPKERIMINWELTESVNNTENIDNESYLKFGCIDQSCCLQTYFNIKLKYNYLETISYYQFILSIILLVLGIYMYKNIDTENALEEEISDKIGRLILTFITILLFIFISIIFFYQKTYPKQSELNKIENNEVSDSLTLIDRSLVMPAEKNKMIQTVNEIFEIKKKEIINNYGYYQYLDYDDNDFDLLYFDYYLYSDCINISYKEDLSKNDNYFNYTNNTYENKTQIINFKSKKNIISKLLNYFDYELINPIKPINNLGITVTVIFKKKNFTEEFDEKNNNEKFRILNDITNNTIIITKENISLNYNKNDGISKIYLLKDMNLNFSIIDANYPFYIIGNILNDTDDSLINVYSYYFGKNNIIYSVKSNNNGNFILGPLYPLLTSEIFELNIEIYKISKNIDDTYNYTKNYSYHSYNEIIKIGGIDYFGYYFPFHRIKDILLPLKTINKNYEIEGYVYETKGDNNHKSLSSVYVKIYRGNYTYLMNEILENIKNGKNDDYYLSQSISNSNGDFVLHVNSNGHYFLIYEKNNYFIETQKIIINETSENNININKMELIKIFNAGKIIVKLEWESKPNDLDLICRFKVSEKDYCYTFFGNKKCVETAFYRDAKNGNGKFSEVIEIEEFSDYMYLFYVRKYFDESNGESKNERKISGVDMGENLNFTDLYKNNNELLVNSMAKLLVYSNGLKYPMIKIDINDYINEDLTIENSYKKKEDSKDIYWIGFCVNGKEGLNTIKIINKISKNEPAKNICLSYYD